MIARVADALRGSRPESEGPAMEQWGTDVVAVADAFAGLDLGFDRGLFFTACGGL